MQGLIYVFVALSALAIGAAGRFGLNLSIVESVLIGLMFGCIAVIGLERMLRHRAEARLEKGIEDLARLLSTDAQAGGVLSQRLNALVDQNAGSRIEGLEADISVLGTVVRQVAEAVADIEEARHTLAPIQADGDFPDRSSDDENQDLLAVANDPRIGFDDLRAAMADNRMLFHVEPIVMLPQRRTQGYDVVPRLVLDDGGMAEAADFLPRKGNDAVVRHIEGHGLQEAISLARKAASNGQSITLYVTFSHATLADPLSVEQALVVIDSNKPVIGSIIARIDAGVWASLTPGEKLAVGLMARKGVLFSLFNATSLRLDFPDLHNQGVRSVRMDTNQFLDHPETFTDLHTSDIAAYVRRSGIELIATGLKSERQILSLLDDGVGLVQGPHIAGPGPLRGDLLLTAGAEGATRRA